VTDLEMHGENMKLELKFFIISPLALTMFISRN